MPNWDTSLVTDMSGWDGNAFSGFGDRSTFDGDISNWDTSSVTTMSYMFKGASAFNQDISSWTGTARLTAQYECLMELRRFKQIPVHGTPSLVLRVRAF